ncbi:hypothetical protein AMECASPLE_035446 [Ameca splendens]|uniref:Secreted protein n=1 Tax=Ameca splendens TaxID=208324 RepID=A0ABV0XWV1_9TELE
MKRRQNNPKIGKLCTACTLLIQISAATTHNKGVTSALARALKSSPELHGVDYASIVYHCGVSGCKTHYKTMRRNFQYSQPDHAKKAAAIRKSARRRSRRKRLLETSVLEAEELAF